MASTRQRLAAALAFLLALTVFVALSPGTADAAKPDKRVKHSWKSAINSKTYGIHSFTTRPETAGSSIRNTCSPYWRDINPAPGVWKWSELDATIEEYKTWGYSDVMFGFCGTPAWAGGLGRVPGVEYGTRGWGDPPAKMSYYREMVTKVVNRYKGKIQYYQPWNEVTAIASWQGTGQQLAEMTKILNQVVKKVDPGARVVSPSFQVYCHPECTKDLLGPFLKKSKKYKWPFDAFTVHSYAEGINGRYEKTRKVLDYVESFKMPLRVKIWDTETNHIGGGLSASQEKAFVSRAFLDSYRLGLSRTYWYMWTNGSGDFGDVALNPRTPQAIESFNTMLEWTVDTQVKSCSSQKKVLKCSFKGGGKKFDVVWTLKGKSTYKASGKKQACPATGGACKTVKKGKFKATIMPHRLS